MKVTRELASDRTISISRKVGFSLAVDPSLNLDKVRDKARDGTLQQDIVPQHHALGGEVSLVIGPQH